MVGVRSKPRNHAPDRGVGIVTNAECHLRGNRKQRLQRRVKDGSIERFERSWDAIISDARLGLKG